MPDILNSLQFVCAPAQMVFWSMYFHCICELSIICPLRDRMQLHCMPVYKGLNANVCCQACWAKYGYHCLPQHTVSVCACL